MLVVLEQTGIVGALPDLVAGQGFYGIYGTHVDPASIFSGSNTLISPVSIPAAMTPRPLVAVGQDQAIRLNLTLVSPSASSHC